MVFDGKGWARQVPGTSTLAPQAYGYKSVDTLAVILGAGYFDEQSQDTRLQEGDEINVVFEADLTAGDLGTDPFATVNTTAVVTVTSAAHGLATNDKVRFNGAPAVNGIPAVELNATHVITVVTVDTYTVTVSTNATSTGVGGGTSIAFSSTSGTPDRRKLAVIDITGDVVTVAAEYLDGSKTFDSGSIADGNEEVTEITVTGAALGDFCIASSSIDVLDLAVVASVTAADTVTLQLLNNTGGAIDLASATVRCRVFPLRAFL